MEESNKVIMNEDDDKYLLDINKDEEEAESYLDKEKRR
jgi:hypothetical protein